ncbi:MAG: WYL domain-containing protein, partial [Gammaproteobacteria bacterium]
MRKASDTMLRYLAMLPLIPAHPGMISAAQLKQRLRNQNSEFEVNIRSVQRDLEKLSLLLPLVCESRGRGKLWCWSEKYVYLQIPAMNNSTALAFLLAADYLKPLMPPATLRLLEPYFRHAAKALRAAKLGKWREKTRIIARGPELLPPPIKPKVQEVVYQALLEGRQFEVDYQSRAGGAGKRQTLNPLGIVIRAGVIYLVATAWDYADLRHFALHRMRRAALLDKPAAAPADFDLAMHIEEDNRFGYPRSSGRIKLRALFAEGAAVHLRESKLSADQKVVEKGDGRVLIEASVADTAELRWWLLGFGAGVEVLG